MQGNKNSIVYVITYDQKVPGPRATPLKYSPPPL